MIGRCHGPTRKSSCHMLMPCDVKLLVRGRGGLVALCCGFDLTEACRGLNGDCLMALHGEVRQQVMNYSDAFVGHACHGAPA